ncbi:hypothetical protein L7F22_037049 [Adiantum nelumboides]|nr:hypothetical protein [Adiantum nelumboides]
MSLQDALRDGIVNQVKLVNLGSSQGPFTRSFARPLEMPVSKPNRAPLTYLKEDKTRGFSQGFAAQPTKLVMDVPKDKPLSQLDAPPSNICRGLEKNLFQQFGGNADGTEGVNFGHFEALSPGAHSASSNRDFNPSDSEDSTKHQASCVKIDSAALRNCSWTEIQGGFNPKWDPQLLIEIDLNKDLIYEVPIKDSDGNWLHSQLVRYRNLPNVCFHCHKLGHHIKNCPEMATKDHVPEPKDDPHQGFQQVNKRNSMRQPKSNKSFIPKGNSFKVLLEDVFDPLNQPGTSDFGVSKGAQSELANKAQQSLPVHQNVDHSTQAPHQTSSPKMQNTKLDHFSSPSDSDEEAIPNSQVPTHEETNLDFIQEL